MRARMQRRDFLRMTGCFVLGAPFFLPEAEKKYGGGVSAVVVTPPEVLKKKIMPITQAGMRGLIQKDREKNWGEVGGFVHEDATMLYFYEAENEFDVTYQDVLRVQEGNLAVLGSLDQWLDKYHGEKSSACAPTKTEEGDHWKSLVGRVYTAREQIAAQQGGKRVEREVVDEYVAAFREVLDWRYSQGKIYEKNPQGKEIGDFHLHNNGTDFSNSDKCSASETRLSFVISHSYPEERAYQLFVLYKKETVLLGTFSF